MLPDILSTPEPNCPDRRGHLAFGEHRKIPGNSFDAGIVVRSVMWKEILWLREGFKVLT